MVLDMDTHRVQDGDNGKAFLSGHALTAAAGRRPSAGAVWLCDLKIRLMLNCHLSLHIIDDLQCQLPMENTDKLPINDIFIDVVCLYDIMEFVPVYCSEVG